MDLNDLLKTVKEDEGLYKAVTRNARSYWTFACSLRVYCGEGELYSVVDDGEVKLVVLMIRNSLATVEGLKDITCFLNELRQNKRKFKDPSFRSFKKEDMEGVIDSTLSKRIAEHLIEKNKISIKKKVEKKEEPKPDPKKEEPKKQNLGDLLKQKMSPPAKKPVSKAQLKKIPPKKAKKR